MSGYNPDAAAPPNTKNIRQPYTIFMLLAGQTFEEPPQPPPDDGDVHPAQRRLFEALTAPVANTVEDEHRRRNNAILAVMTYCPIQEPPLPRGRRGTQAAVSKAGVSQTNTAADEGHQANDEHLRLCHERDGAASSMLPLSW